MSDVKRAQAVWPIGWRLCDLRPNAVYLGAHVDLWRHRVDGAMVWTVESTSFEVRVNRPTLEDAVRDARAQIEATGLSFIETADEGDAL